MTQYILAFDMGTTGVQSTLFDAETFQVAAHQKVDFPQIFPQSGWVEHNPQDFWGALVASLEKNFEKMKVLDASFRPQNILTIGLTNQRETVVAWNKKSGAIAGNAIVWQDRRTADVCTKIKSDKTLCRKIQRITGLFPDPYFSATKMAWFLKNNAQCKQWAKKNELALGTVDCYILFRLTGGKQFLTDHTNASRTMLYDIKKLNYSLELLDFFQIDRDILPEICDSTHHFGLTNGVPGLPDGISITGVLGDQQSALLGQQCVKKGNSKITFGTGAFLLINLGENSIISKQKLLTSVAIKTKKKLHYCLEGSLFVAGSAMQFLRDNLNLIDSTGVTADMAMAASPDDNLIFVPALAGLSAPHWNPNARGVLLGLHRGTGKNQIVRAFLESLAFQSASLLQLMEQDAGIKIKKIMVDGGASQNDFMIQFLSDLLQKNVLRPKNTETTSLGAALCAFLGMQKFDALPDIAGEEQIFSKQMTGKWARERLQRWEKAVQFVDEFYG